MQPGRRHSEAQRRAAERRQREDEAPRLLAVVPRLTSLEIAFADGERGTASTLDHIRRVVIDRAPALFEQRCANPSCKTGGHDLTHEIVSGLTRGMTRIEGEDACLGAMTSGTCGWVLKYVATATFRPA